MTSLYDTGDVAEQKSITTTTSAGSSGTAGTSAAGMPAGFGGQASMTITLEDIMAGNLNSSNTPPSPQFAPALKNYPSSSSLMAKSPSLRTLANNTNFDNHNRGWESDAPEGEGYAVGQGADDDEDDNGEVPWHLMTNSEKKKSRPSARLNIFII